MRALRIELRRSVAPGALVLLVVLGIVGFLWGIPGGWTAMTTLQRQGTLITWPLAVGVGAWQARRERMAGLGELFATSPRSPAQRLAPVAATLALAVLTAYLLVLLVGTALMWRSPADLYFTPEGVATAAVGAVSHVTAAWLGLWIGRLLPSAFTAPIATVLTVAVTVVLTEMEAMSATGPAYSMLLPVLELPYQQDHVQLPLELSGYQGLWLLALAVTVYAIATSSDWLRRLLALVPALVAVLILIPALPLAGSLRAFVVNQTALTPVCTRDAPKVCVIREHSGLLNEVTGPARTALTALAELPDAPASAMEVPEAPVELYRPNNPDTVPPPAAVPPLPPGVLALSFDTAGNGHVDDPAVVAAYVLRDWLTPGRCPQEARAHSYDRLYYAAQDIAGAWLIAQAPGVEQLESSDAEMFEPNWTAFTALPEATQKERVVAYRDAARACRPSDQLFTLLTRGTA